MLKISLLEDIKGLRGQDLNLRPSGYEPDELPGCSTPRLRWHDLLAWAFISPEVVLEGHYPLYADDSKGFHCACGEKLFSRAVMR